MCILDRKDSRIHRMFNMKKDLLIKSHPWGVRYAEILTFDPVLCPLSRQKAAQHQDLYQSRNPQCPCEGGCVAQSLLDMTGTFHYTVSLQSRLRYEWLRCHLTDSFSLRIEITFEKLALNVLAHIQRLTSTTWTSHTDAGWVPNVDEVSAKVFRRNLAEDTCHSNFSTGPFWGSLGVDESKGSLK